MEVFVWFELLIIKIMIKKSIKIFSLTELTIFRAELIIWLLLLLFELLLFSNDCLCLGDLGLIGVRLIGDIGGECNDGGDFDLKWLLTILFKLLAIWVICWLLYGYVEFVLIVLILLVLPFWCRGGCLIWCGCVKTSFEDPINEFNESKPDFTLVASFRKN